MCENTCRELMVIPQEKPKYTIISNPLRGFSDPNIDLLGIYLIYFALTYGEEITLPKQWDNKHE